MLINPYIEGSLPKVFQADNSIKAAKKAYETLSNYFNNSVHNFKFTLLKVKSDSVDEKKSQISNFNLEQYGGSPKINDLILTISLISLLMKLLIKIKMYHIQ